MSKKSSKHKKSYKKIAFVIILIIIVILNVKKSKEQNQNHDTQIILNNSNITEDLQEEIIKENGKIYMNFDDVQKFIDETLYEEKETGLIITTSPKKLATFKYGEENININGSIQEEKDVVIKRDDKEYIAISTLENVYDYDFHYIDSVNIATIDNLNKKIVKAYAKKKINIKQDKNVISRAVDKVEKGNWLIFIEEENGFAKVRTQNGIIGYTKNKNLTNFVTEREDFNQSSNEDNLADDKTLEYDISKKDISTFEKRKNIINLILQEAIKNDKICVKILNNNAEEDKYNRFKIEATPILSECGVKIKF